MKIIKLKDLFKRTCATTLAVACFMSSAAFMPIEELLQVFASTTISFNFKDNIDGGNYATPIEILEGIPIYIGDNLTDASTTGVTYSYNATTPIQIVNNDLSDVEKANILSNYLTTGTITQSRYIQPLIGLTDAGYSYIGPKDDFEFVIEPVLQYSISRDATHDFYFRYTGLNYTYTTSADEDNFLATNSYETNTWQDATVKIQHTTEGSDIHLTEQTNKFRIVYAGTIEDGKDVHIENLEREYSKTDASTEASFISNYKDWRTTGWEIQNAEGYFTGYKIKDNGVSLKTDGITGLVEGIFDLVDANGLNGITVSLTIQPLELTKYVYKDSYIELDFSYETSSDRLSYIVKNRQTAVDEIATLIKENPTEYSNNSEPKYSSSGLEYLRNNNRPFIYTNTFDSTGVNDVDINAITSGFYLKIRHAEYNYANGFYVTWEWQPYDTIDADVYNPGPPPKSDDYAVTQNTGESDEDFAIRKAKALEDYYEALEKYEIEEKLYLEYVGINETLNKAVTFSDFDIVETVEGSGLYKWSNSNSSTNRNAGSLYASITRDASDIVGDLVAKVHIFDDDTFKDTTYNTSNGYYGDGYTVPISSEEVRIPITIIGKGEEPRFYISTATAATYNKDTYSYSYADDGLIFEYEDGEQTSFPIFKYNEVLEVIEEVELGQYVTGNFNMDVNNGQDNLNLPPADIPAGYAPPIPVAPYQVEGVIEFGSGLLQCDRLVIENVSDVTSGANIFMQYRLDPDIPTPLATHNFATDGNTFEIPIDYNVFESPEDYIYYFTVDAYAEGTMKLDLKFYNDSDGNLIEPLKTYRDVGISIASSLPSDEAKLDRIYLHLVQEETDNASEDARIADILADLYYDKSTINNLNPHNGSTAGYDYLPTDIIYNTDFTYVESGNYYYYEAEVPYVISDVKVTPIYDSVAQANGALYLTVSNPGNVDKTITGYGGTGSGDYEAVSDEMAVIANNNDATYNTTSHWILLETLAADSNSKELYYLKLVQQEAESQIVLTDLYVKTENLLGEPLDLDLNNAAGTVVEFVTDPVGVGARYYITLPYYYYSQQIPVEITATSNSSWSKSPTIVSDDGLSQPKTSFISNLWDTFSNETTEKFYLNYDDVYGLGSNAVGSTYPNKFTITTYSESSNDTSEYYLTIYISAPDTNDDLSSLEVLDPTSDDEVIAFKNGAFYPTKDDYIVEIPYELQKYRFSALPDSENAIAVRLTAPDGTIIGSTTYASAGNPIQFLVDFETLGLTSTDLNFTFTIGVQSEDGNWSDMYNHPEGHSPYTILFQRSAPNTDSLLASLDVYNFETAAPLDEYVFEQVKKDYIFTVPYTTERIIIKPTANEQDYTTITINGVDFPDEDPGKDYYLTAGEMNTFTIVVTAEDASYTTTYNLYITRANPDTEARLLNLVVNGASSVTPDTFIPSVYVYDYVIPAGTSTYTITPTAVSEYSVILIDGVVIPSGTATSPYQAVDEKTTIYVYVSAQDGETTQVYTLNITNQNLSDLSEEALLLNVNIQGADIEPTFVSNIYDYETYVKPDTTALDITPTISKNATVTVSVGSKKLDELNSIYSTSFFTDTDTIKIVVTSESGNTSNTYQFSVHKNDDEKSGIFKPITSSDIDFKSENPIVVDISKYSVIDASVFNTMKDDYPEKTIVFSGNDYMIRFNGEDVLTTVPHTMQYDFGMSFTSPEERLVQAILNNSDYDEDNELEPIYVYFNDHGTLPAEVILTIILGSEVGDSQLYWNYYNTEFDRIDYYGYVQSNSKGTITVPLAHFSTYLVSTHQIYVSEDRTNTGFGALQNGNHTSDQADGSIGSEGFGDDLTGGFGTGSGSNGNISGSLTENKPNPQTISYDIGTNYVTSFPISTERVAYEQQTTVYKWYEEKRNKKQKDNFQEC